MCRSAPHMRCSIDTLPSLRMVFAETRTEVFVPARVRVLVILVHVDLLWVLLEVGHVVMGSMSALEDGIGGLRLLLSLPEEVLAETDCQLGREHVATRRSGGEGELMGGGGSAGDGLCGRPSIPKSRVLRDGLQATRLHHQGATIVGLD